uniref:Uncharacterized protein n=1 Tax=Amphimedon queenslandica TaxID=400682 RepID=A0A1X7T9Z2_AMPQE
MSVRQHWSRLYISTGSDRCFSRWQPRVDYLTCFVKENHLNLTL